MKSRASKSFLFIITFFLLVISNVHAASDTVTVRRPDMGFQVDFFGKPDEATREVDTRVGKLNMHTFMFNGAENPGDDNLFYMLAITDYPDEIQAGSRRTAMYRDAIDGTVARIEGKVLSEKQIEVDSHSGREARVEFQGGDAVVTLQIFMVDNRFYLLQTICNNQNDKNAAMHYFFSSFSFLKKNKQ